MPHIHGFKCAQRIEIPGAARFLTFSCHDQRRIFAPWSHADQFAQALCDYARSGDIELHAWALMPDHVHMLLTPHDSNLAQSLSLFKQSVARRLAQLDGASIPLWRPGGGYDRTVYSCGEFKEKREYIHRNAVRAGLVATAAEWRWHSWHEQCGKSREDMPRIAAMNADRLVMARRLWFARLEGTGASRCDDRGLRGSGTRPPAGG
jgi:putative transposase